MAQTKSEKTHAAKQQSSPERIASIDALRGFDMFWIMGGREFVLAFAALVFSKTPPWLILLYMYKKKTFIRL